MHNYKYDKIGNLVADKSEKIEEISWTMQGKVKRITRLPNSDKPDLVFNYDGLGNRVSKTVIPKNSLNNEDSITTYYVRDAQGNILATYEKTKYKNGDEKFYLKEQYLYGSSRIGMNVSNQLLASKVDGSVEIKEYDGYFTKEIGNKRYELTNHLGNVLVVVSDKKLPDNEPDVVSVSDYYPFGMTMPGRLYSEPSNSYRYGFGSHEKDFEIHQGWYGFGEYGYDARIGRRSTPDPKSALLPYLTTYIYTLNSPIQVIDLDGEFPILINGRVGNDSERGSSTYWSANVRSTISQRTGYEQSKFLYVDGDKSLFPSKRFSAGQAKAKVDAQGVWNKMKATMKDGQITEQLQVITHSRGAAFGAGYMEGLRREIIQLAESEGIGFAYDKNSIIQYSVNLAPHQSNWINYEQSGTMNVNISQIGDPLSGNDATGNVINVQSIPETEAFDQHGNSTYNTQLDFVLDVLESETTNKDNLLDRIKNGYTNYDNNRINGDKSSVKTDK
ncbi:MAG: hypothetical protein H6544_05550 [Prevotellaceae bacterium]|nr:hypothetical protein [Prevotellaceae bacterium]